MMARLHRYEGPNVPTGAAPPQSPLSMAAYYQPVTSVQPFAQHSTNPFIFVFSGASNMVTGETKSFFSFAKSVSQRCSLSFSLEEKSTLILFNEHFMAYKNTLILVTRD